GLILVDEHQRPVAVWTRHGIAGYQSVSGSVLQIAGRGIKFVLPGSMLHPLQINQPARMVLSGEGLDVEIRVGNIVAVSAEAATSGTQRLGLNGRMIVDRASGREESANAVGQPQRGEDVGHLLRVA